MCFVLSRLGLIDRTLSCTTLDTQVLSPRLNIYIVIAIEGTPKFSSGNTIQQNISSRIITGAL